MDYGVNKRLLKRDLVTGKVLSLIKLKTFYFHFNVRLPDKLEVRWFKRKLLN